MLFNRPYFVIKEKNTVMILSEILHGLKRYWLMNQLSSHRCMGEGQSLIIAIFGLLSIPPPVDSEEWPQVAVSIPTILMLGQTLVAKLPCLRAGKFFQSVFWTDDAVDQRNVFWPSCFSMLTSCEKNSCFSILLLFTYVCYWLAMSGYDKVCSCHALRILRI